MLRFLFSLVAFICILLPLISAFPKIIYNDGEYTYDDGYRNYQNKRGLIFPTNGMMLRNFPILRRV